MRTDRQDLRRAVQRLAAAQHGYFTAGQANRAGYSYQAQKFHADHGNWTRVERGLFRLPEWPVDDDDHLVRWTLWSKGRAVVSHQSSLAAHELSDADPAVTHLSVPAGFRQRPPHGIRLHRQTPPDGHIEERDGYRVTTPARAIAECAEESHAQEILDGAISEVLQRGLTTRKRLRDVAAELGPRAELGVERGLQAALT